MPDDNSSSTRRQTIIGLIAILVVTLLAYTPVIVSGGYIWDDDSYLTANPVLVDDDALVRIWTPGNTPQYYPMVFTSFWVEMQLWDLSPRPYHVVNVLLHALNALLLWRVLVRIRVPGAWIAAAIFALHPVHVESVAWITERKNVLSGFFYLLSALGYLRFASIMDGDDGRAKKEAVGWYGISILLFAAALLSKTVTCSLPAALILVMLWQRKPITLKRLLPLAPMFILGVVLALHTASIERGLVGAHGADFDQSFLERTLIACRALVFYPSKVLVPWPLMFIYPRWETAASAAGWVALAIVVATVAMTLLLAARGRRGPFLALSFFAGTVFPALGFINVYPHRFSFVADHFQYLASIGVIVLLAAALATAIKEPARRVLVACVPLVLLFGLTWLQSSTYEDAETVWRDTLEHNPDAWMPRDNLAALLIRRAVERVEEGDLEGAQIDVIEAREHAQVAVDLKPDHHPAHANLSEALRLEGRMDEAVAHAERAVDLGRARIDEAGVTELPAWHARDLYRLAQMRHGAGDLDGAAEAYADALAISPERADWRLERAQTLVQLDEITEAGKEYVEVLRVVPDHFVALGTLASIRDRLGDYENANRLYRAAYAAAPTPLDRVQIVTRLIRFLSECPDEAHRDVDEAIALAEELAKITQMQDPGALAVLASTYAAAGRMEEARETASRAVDLARAAGLDDVVERIETEMAGW